MSQVDEIMSKDPEDVTREEFEVLFAEQRRLSRVFEGARIAWLEAGHAMNAAEDRWHDVGQFTKAVEKSLLEAEERVPEIVAAVAIG